MYDLKIMWTENMDFTGMEWQAVAHDGRRRLLTSTKPGFLADLSQFGKNDVNQVLAVVQDLYPQYNVVVSEISHHEEE